MWVGRDGIMSVSCFSVPIVVSGFSAINILLLCCKIYEIGNVMEIIIIPLRMRGIIHTSPVADTARIVQHTKSHSRL